MHEKGFFLCGAELRGDDARNGGLDAAAPRVVFAISYLDMMAFP